MPRKNDDITTNSGEERTISITPRRRNKVKPTQMQAQALQYIRDGMPMGEAMVKAGYSPNVAKAPGQNLLRSTGGIRIQEAFATAFLQVGMTPIHYAERVVELIEAEKMVPLGDNIYGRMPDHQARAKGLELYRKDMGALDDDTPAGGTTNNTQNNYLVISDEQAKRITAP